MNTKQLQKTFAQVYEEFYAQHKIIFSAPFVFSRVGETPPGGSGVSIKQKIPLRMYIGIHIQDVSSSSDPEPKSKKIQRGNATVFSTHEKQFITTPICDYLTYMLTIQKFVEHHLREYPNVNYRVSLLSELPNTVGLGFDSVFSLLLATVICTATGTIQNTDHLWNDLEILHELQDNKVRKHKKDFGLNDEILALNDPNSSLYKLLRLSHTVLGEILDEYHLDGTIATSLIPKGTPIVSFHEDIYTTPKNHSQKGLFLMHDYKYFVLPISTLNIDDSYNFTLPIDYGILYSGRPLVLENRYQNNIKTDFHNLLDDVQTKLKPYVLVSSGKRKPRFYTDLITPHVKKGNNILESVNGYMSLAMFKIITSICSRGYTEDDIKGMIQTITKIRHMYNILHKPSNHLVKLIDSIYQQIGFRSDQIGVCYNDVNKMGGSLIFATPIEGIRNDLSQILFALQRIIPGVELLYASWRDGNEENGLICEQNLFVQKPSKFMHSNLLMMEVLNGQGGTRFGTYEQLITHMDVDIVLDTINMKIYAYGQKVTSKELHSQSGTIEMLLTTLDHLDDDVSNKQLPVSSYSKSKNDMVGKIILPLTRLIKEKLNKELPIECFGGMYEYYLRLKKSNVRFGIMKRVQEV